MLRRLLLVIFSALLLLGMGELATASLGEGAGLVADAGDDCCPSEGGESDLDGDCCDSDFGLCCASGAVGLASTGTDSAPHPAVALDDRVPLPTELLRARATGPPPTPPPIG